jgi:hypothetical protein
VRLVAKRLLTHRSIWIDGSKSITYLSVSAVTQAGRIHAAAPWPPGFPDRPKARGMARRPRASGTLPGGLPIGRAARPATGPTVPPPIGRGPVSLSSFEALHRSPDRVGRLFGFRSFRSPMSALIFSQLLPIGFSPLPGALQYFNGICSPPFAAGLSGLFPVCSMPIALVLRARLGVLERHSASRRPSGSLPGIVTTPTADGERLSSICPPKMPPSENASDSIEPHFRQAGGTL